MGLEITDMSIHDLEDILYETSQYNGDSFSTFKEALFDMYGGIYSDSYKKLVDFIREELEIHSDAELTNIDEYDKKRIVEFVSKLH